MKRHIANALRSLARWVDPNVYQMQRTGPILQEDVDDLYGGVVPDGRWLYPARPVLTSADALIRRLGGKT